MGYQSIKHIGCNPVCTRVYTLICIYAHKQSCLTLYWYQYVRAS